jgi:hypothetical protein
MIKKGCIIIPYRDRKEHLKTFLNKVKVDLDIIVVEQFDNNLFNRGKLLNIGFELNKDLYDYFIFHDVDMIPFKNIDYSYCENICHMATFVEQFEYKAPPHIYFGGVNLFPKEKFIQINGFGNNYWGWGQEDDNLYFRCKYLNLPIEIREIRYNSLSHKPNHIEEVYEKNLEVSKNFTENPELIFKDGLNTLNYTLISIENKEKYKLIKIKNDKT